MKKRNQVLLVSASVIGVLVTGCKIILELLISQYTDPFHKKVAKAGFDEKMVTIGKTQLA